MALSLFQTYSKCVYEEKSYQLHQEYPFPKAVLKDLASRPDHLHIIDNMENYHSQQTDNKAKSELEEE